MSCEAIIKIGYKESIKLLKKVSLFKSENRSRKSTFTKEKFSKEFIHFSQKDDYKKIYDVAVEKGDYDILLNDNSFFQFSYDENSNGDIYGIRYAYYNVPYEVECYEDFLKNIGFNYNDVGESFLDEYEQCIAEANLKNQIIPMRYDYDIEGYQPIVHASSHMHIGHNNEIRIPCDKILSPQTFVSFIIRHIYFQDYKGNIKENGFKGIYLNKTNIVNDINTLNDEEKCDIYLS